VKRRLIGLLACSLVAVGAAAASPTDDYTRVRVDWQEDGSITACRFSEAELQNARSVAESSPDFSYTGLVDAIDVEIARWRSGGCSGLSPESKRARSALDGLRITAVKPKAELVVIFNRTRKPISLTGARLHNRRGNRRVAFRRGTKIRGRKHLIVQTGCLKGKRRATVKGGRYYACQRRELWRDRGDVARLSDRKRVVVSQLGYGTQRRAPKF
jgi:hypothetical protein